MNPIIIDYPRLHTGLSDHVLAYAFAEFKRIIEADKNARFCDGKKGIRDFLAASQKAFGSLRVRNAPSGAIYGDDFGFSESDLDRLADMSQGVQLYANLREVLDILECRFKIDILEYLPILTGYGEAEVKELARCKWIDISIVTPTGEISELPISRRIEEIKRGKAS